MIEINKKIFHDAIHGTITLSNIAIKIIDTPEFQRLRNIKQLGSVYMVFSSASHNRFEHSLGVAYLAKKILESIKQKQNELVINDQDIINVEIAGLCHDLGHGPFSHIFDDLFLFKKYQDSEFRHHEERSCVILEKIVKKYNIQINDKNLEIIKNMINPIKNKKYKNNYLYQIVSNSKNGIDVDKLDYLARDAHSLGLNSGIDFFRFFHNFKVVNDEIIYSDKEIFNIYEMFHTRFKMHKQVYSHIVVKKIDMMLSDILFLIYESKNIYFNFDKIFDNNLEIFCQLTDSFLENLEWFCNNFRDKCDEKILKANEIYQRIKKRNFYKLVEELSLTYEESIDKYLEKYNLKNYDLSNDYCYLLKSIGYSCNNINPLRYVKFFNKYKILSSKEKGLLIGNILPRNFSEKHLLIFKK